MAFGAKKIFPLDTRPGTGIGVSLPFNAPATFFSTYTTREAIKNNLINFFLTNPTERYLNNNFGFGLRKYIFEQITTGNLDFLKENIQASINRYFKNIKIENLEILQNPDTNEINIILKYSIINTGESIDTINVTFT
jgi:phage baseplate assembly protein W